MPAAAPNTLLRKAAILPFVGLVYAYRLTLGPLLGGQCRFHPTCSQYALDAYRAHGPILGTFLTLRRLSRCHPFGGGGYDPATRFGDKPTDQSPNIGAFTKITPPH
jgi:hypothetical protein